MATKRGNVIQDRSPEGENGISKRMKGLDPDDPGKAMENFIINNYVNLTNRLEVEKVLPYLIQWRILSIDERERIENKETERGKVGDLLGTLSRSGKCTPELFIKVLEETHQTALIDSLNKSVNEERLPADSNVLPAKLQLEYVQRGKTMLLDMVNKIFDHRISAKQREELKKEFKWLKAAIDSIIDGCFVINLTFLQPCDVDDFYHDHFRVGPGSLSAALSDILITDEMRAVVGGEELMVRLEVRYDDYIRVRRRLCTTGLQKSASVDNLPAMLLPPKETDCRPLLNSLDLATSTQDSSFTHWATDPCTKQLVFKMKKTSQALRGLEAKHEIAKHQIELQVEMVRSLQREVTRLTKKQETAQKLLLDNKKEIEDVTEATKGMQDTKDELFAENTKLTNKLEVKEHEEKLKGDKVVSLQREVTRLIQEQEAAQEALSDKRKEIEHLTAAIKSMEDNIDELTNKLALMELEGDKVEILGKVTRLTHEKEMALRHGDGVWIFVDDSNIWIEAKKLAGSLRNLKTTEDPRVRVDIGKLGNLLAAGRPVIKGTLYTSVPPPIDTVWDKVRMQGWKVCKDQKSMRTGKDKKLDHQLVADVTELVCDKENLQFGNTVIIVTGNSDVMPAIEKALKMRPWKVEVRMWESGLAGDIVRATRTDPDRLSVSTLDSDFDKIVFINYHFNLNKSTKDLLLQNAVVLVNPEHVDMKQWRNKMDEKCGYPFQYYNMYKGTASNRNDHLVVVVFSMLGKNGLADMLAKIRRNSDLNCNSQAILTYFQMVNSEDYSELTALTKLYMSDEEEAASGSDEGRFLQFKEQEDDTGEPFQIVRKKTNKPKSKQLYSDQCPYKFNCKHGRDCHYAHSDAEMQFFRKRDRDQSKEERYTRRSGTHGYKSMLCSNYALSRMCRNGDRCRFAHGEEDAVCMKCNDRGHFTESCPDSLR